MTETVPGTDTQVSRPHRSLWVDVWQQFSTHTGALIGVGVFGCIVLAVSFGPFIHDLDPTYLDIRARNQNPSWTHNRLPDSSRATNSSSSNDG